MTSAKEAKDAVMTVIERCIVDDCVIEIPQRLKLCHTDYGHLSRQQKNFMRGKTCFYWSEKLFEQLTVDIWVPKLLAREGIKCLIDCYLDPPARNTEENTFDYLSYALLQIAIWGCVDLLPPKSKINSNGVQHSFDFWMNSLNFVSEDVGLRLLSLLLIKHPKYPNKGWLLEFEFSAENVPVTFEYLVTRNLYDEEALCILLKRGMTVTPTDIIFAHQVLSNEEYFIFHELMKGFIANPISTLCHPSIDQIKKSRKLNFAAIVCLHCGDTEKFIQLACSPGVCLSNMEQLVKMLTTKDCSNLFNELCSNRITEKCLIVLESGNCLPNVLLPIFLKHISFILETKGLAAIFMELLKLHSSSTNMINNFFKACTSKSLRMPIALKYKVALVLAEKGGDIDLLKLAYTQGSNGTAIHGAVELCLKEGDFELLSTVCEVIKRKSPSQLKVFTARDSKKSSPYHLIMKLGKDRIAAEVCNVLSSFNFIDPTEKDKKGKTPIRYTKGRERTEAYKKAIAKWTGGDINTVQQTSQSTLDENIKKPNNPNVQPTVDISCKTHERNIEKDPTPGFNRQSPAIESTLLKVDGDHIEECRKQCESVIDCDKPDQESEDTGKAKNCKEEEQIICLSLEELMKSLHDKELDYFKAANVSDDESENELQSDEPENDTEMPDLIEVTKVEATDDKEDTVEKVDVEVWKDQHNDGVDDIDFSSLPWEIVISKQAADLLKASKTPKNVVSDIKKKLKRIGEGERSEAICHKWISPKHRLIETYLYRAARIIWCEDIQYSESKSNPAEGQIVYCDVIKILWIALKHSTNQLNDVLQRIKECLDKSKESKGKKLKLHQASHHDPKKEFAYPRIFYPANQVSNYNDIDHVQHHPLPNLYGGEFSVMQFHPFSEFINTILNSDPSERECSISMSQQEHEIIKLPYGKEPLIVCGRSGTGKTTTCIYRMWNEFRSTWEKLQAIESESENDLYDSNDYLHQVFVTKSPVLCSQVKKEFDKLLVSWKADNFNRESLKMNSSFRDCGDNMFPLFLTSKKLLFILDASLPGEKFFPRDENKEFKVDFNFSDYDETKDPENLFLEFEEHKGNKTQSNSVKPAATEVNADYFCNNFWNKLPDKFRLETIDPLLVWTEIHSFIKGSMEALESENGFISRNEYKALGRHAAPSFADDEAKRDMCYDIFEQYSKCLNELKKKLYI